MWTKIKTWWATIKAWITNLTVGPVLGKIGKAIRQFLRYAYAAQISYLVLSVLFYLSVNKFVGVILFAWGIILLIAEIKQQKAEKITNI